MPPISSIISRLGAGFSDIASSSDNQYPVWSRSSGCTQSLQAPACNRTRQSEISSCIAPESPARALFKRKNPFVSANFEQAQEELTGHLGVPSHVLGAFRLAVDPDHFWGLCMHSRSETVGGTIG